MDRDKGTKQGKYVFFQGDNLSFSVYGFKYHTLA